MAFGWSKTRYSPIAVDFGTDSIKLLQVILGEPPQLIAAAAMEVPPEARTDVAARQEFLQSALSSMVRSQPFKGKRAILSLPSSQTLIQHFQIAGSETEDMAMQIDMNLRQRMNVDPSRMVVRNFPVTTLVREGSSKQETICVAASRDAIMNHIELAHRAKLDVVGMHCEPLAILKSFGHMFRNSQQGSIICFLDMGASSTKVVISHGPQMVFAKTIHIGGDHLTTHLARAQGISFAEARAMRMNITGAQSSEDQGMAMAGAAAAAPATPPVPTGAAGGLAMIEARMAAERRAQGHAEAAPTVYKKPVADPAHETIECLIDELQLCLRHHQSVFPEQRVEKLVFLGGESRHVDICQKIARSLHIGAQLGDPLARAVRLTQSKTPSGVDLRQSQPGWAVPMGLCLSEANL
jgi:type IV pilus assembly protein PilM